MAEQNNNLYVKVARRVMENGVWYTLTAFPLPHHHSSSRNKHKLASRLGHVSVVKHIDWFLTHHVPHAMEGIRAEPLGSRQKQYGNTIFEPGW